ncbi:MAG: hypothetical protein KME23_18610 [Goleter apudmare HA4340-LM2]|jgi:hypothetical protein|nr:hypothetical protein [Goleter apudmare HA4340-LM2]
MSVEQMRQKIVLVNTTINQKNQSEVKQEQAKQEGFTIPDIAISLSPIGFVFSWVVFFILLRKIRTFIENKMVFTVHNSHKVPCKNCQYYSNNHYLKCAVKPSIVLTDEAHNCSEYSPKKGMFFPQNLLRKDENSD